MNRAYSVLNVKSLDGEKRTISGIATTPTPDRVKDVVDPLGVAFKNPMPFLWQHRADQPIGTVKFGTPTKDGIPFEAEIAHTEEEGTLKARLDEAWQSIKLGLVRAVSIGFRSLEHSYKEDGGIHFHKSEVFELSAVTIPANADAIISTVKSLDTAAREEAGIKDEPTEIEAETDEEKAAIGNKSRVVKLNTPSRDREPEFVIKTIKRTR